MGKKNCKRDGCAKLARKGGVCTTHGATRKRCSQEGCANGAVKGGLCATHGARTKRCSNEGCANRARQGGVCVTHGATKKRCSQVGCAKQVRKGGLCFRHGAHSTAAAAQNGAARPLHPAGGYKATVVVASAIAGGGGGEIEIDARNLQADVRCASPPRSPCLRPSITTPNFSDDEISAWIWRYSRVARLGSVNNLDSAL